LKIMVGAGSCYNLAPFVVAVASMKKLWLPIFLMFTLALGYLAGSHHIIGRLRYGTTAHDAEPRRSTDPERQAAVDELRGFLESGIEQHRDTRRYWRELLAAADPDREAETLGRLRAEVQRLLAARPDMPPERPARVEPWFEEAGVTVSRVALPTYPGVTLRCALLVPADATTTPRPGLLVLHGFGGTLDSVVRDIDYHHGFAMQLAQRGYVVLAPFMASSTVEDQSLLHMRALAGGFSMAAIDLGQLTRAVDYLAGLDTVDGTHLGVYGISWGGQHALRLGALDPRLTLTICSGHFADRFAWVLRNPLMPKVPAVHIHYLHDMGVLLDDLNLVALIRPRFFAVESGVDDPRHDSARAEFRHVAALYAHAGHPERAAFFEFPGGHETAVDRTHTVIKQWAKTDSTAF
jgi:hypothetical protein